MKKNYVMIIALVFISTFFLIMKNKKVLDDNEEMPNFGDIGGGILFSGIQVSFSDSSFNNKNVQDAIEELHTAILTGCYVGYTKGTTTSTQYVCNKGTASAFSTLQFEAADVNYDNTSSGLASTNVSDALIELAGEVSYCSQNFHKDNETSSSYDCIINTQPSTLTMTDSQVSLIYGGSDGENAYTYDGDGTVSCVSGDTTKVTCSVDTANNKIIVTPIAATETDQSLLYVTITVSASATPNYFAPSSTTFVVSVSRIATTCTSGSAGKTYDGSALTSPTSGSCTNLPSGYTAAFTNSGTITNAGSTANTISTVVIRDSNSNDVSSNFNITKSAGTLTVSKANPTLSTVSSGSGNCQGVELYSITTNSNGSLSCSSNKPAVVTCGIDNINGTKSVSPSPLKKGSATLTITVAESNNYNSKSVTMSYTVTSCWTYKHKYDDTPTCTCTGGSCCQAKYCGGTVGVSINKNKARCGSSSSSVPTGSGTGKYCWCNLGA